MVVQKQVKVASALRRLAKQDNWPASYWQGFLWHLAGPREGNEPPARLHAHVARILAEAPDRLLNEVGSAAAGFVSRLAEEHGIDRESEFGTALDEGVEWQGRGRARGRLTWRIP